MRSASWIWKAVVAGFCGSMAHSLLMYFKSRTGLLPSFQPYDALQTTLARITGSAIHPALPWLLSFVNGSTFAGLAFGYGYRWLPGGNGAIKGLIFGVIAWAIMGLAAFPMIGLGFFAFQLDLGVSPAIFSLGMLLAYSVTLGLVYDALDR
jgi:hypothetical protein